MVLPLLSPGYTIPAAAPSSPPATPDSARLGSTTSASHAPFNPGMRHGFLIFGQVSPPENITPLGPGHQFTYTPPDRKAGLLESETESLDADNLSPGLSKDKTPVPGSDDDSVNSARRPSIVRTLDEETDFSIEELSDDDISYDELEVILPDQTEEAISDAECDILDALRRLQCGGEEEQEKAYRFERAQRRSYQRRKKRWSMGGFKKRSHTESVGSQSSEHEDIEPLDNIKLPGASARRLRRRTKGPDDGERPNRTSLLFEDPPLEYDELAIAEELPPFPEELHFHHFDLWSSEEEEPTAEDTEYLLPQWLMEIESTSSRPSTAHSKASQRILGRA